MWQIPEAELHVLGDVAGKDVLELGCGAAQWSISLAGLGARPVGLDLSPKQLEHARTAMAEAGVELPLIEAIGDELRNNYFENRGFEDEDGVDFQLPYGEWIRLFRANGLIVDDLIELRPAPDATSSYDTVPLEWARRMPAEHIWKARKP